VFPLTTSAAQTKLAADFMFRVEPETTAMVVIFVVGPAERTADYDYH
jgi:hypothetical protein